MNLLLIILLSIMVVLLFFILKEFWDRVELAKAELVKVNREIREIREIRGRKWVI